MQYITYVSLNSKVTRKEKNPRHAKKTKQNPKPNHTKCSGSECETTNKSKERSYEKKKAHLGIVVTGAGDIKEGLTVKTSQEIM